MRRDPGRQGQDRSSLPRQSRPAAASPIADEWRYARPARQPLPRTAADLPALGRQFWDVLDAGLATLGLELTDGARSALDAQARLLLAWNRSINLTALGAEVQIARGHILDSLSGLELLRSLSCRSLLDLGSGAGYPGLPLAVALPANRAALVDSVHKKHAFLEVVAAAAANALEQAGEQAPQLTPLAERAEDLAEGPDQREGWDVVVARAVGSLAEVVELGLPLVRLGGHIIAWKRLDPAGTLTDELRRALRLSQAAGGSPPEVHELPRLAAAGLPEHVLVVVRKQRPTPDRYPRPPAERRRGLLP